MSEVLQVPSRSARGADAEVSRLYAEYGDKLFRFCLGQLRSREEAEDAVQNTFLRVCTALRKGVVPEFEGPWLYKIAHNVCLSRRLGSSRRSKVETPADLDTLGERAAAHTPDADELFGLDDALADMPPNLRQPLLMREWQGMSYAEISEALGVSHSAVETLIFRARRHLAQALTDSAKKSGRAVASIFNIRWLYSFFKSSFGGGAGGMGMAAGAAGLVVAIGGGVAVDLATQHASAASKPITSAVAAVPLVAADAAHPSGSGPATEGTRGARFALSSSSAPATTHAGSNAAAGGGRHPASGPSSAGSAQSPARPAGPGAASSPSSAATAPSAASNSPARSSASSSHASAGSSPVKRPPSPAPGQAPSPSLPPVPAVPDPGSVIPPVVVPPVPAVPLPPAPALPPLAPPTIAAPSSLVAEATGPLGAAVAYTVTASNVNGSVPVSCAPLSGSTFQLGHTTVSCSSTDSQGNTSRTSFDVQVRDTTAPALAVPAGITAQASLSSGVKVSYSATAKDLVDGAPKVACSPASGSVFLVQTTTVTCTATDASGNTSSKSFPVTVTLAPKLP